MKRLAYIVLPLLTTAMRIYLAAQFVAAAFAVLWIGNEFARSGVTAVFLPCLLLWASLYSFGLLSETRSYAVRLELLRLLAILPLGIAAMMPSTITDAASMSTVWVATAAYSIVSTVCLWVASGHASGEALSRPR